MPTPEVRRVVLTYRDQSARARAIVVAFIERTWLGLREYRDADIERFIAAVVPIVTGGQRQIASLTDAYLAQLEQVTLGEVVRPQGIPRDSVGIETLRGVPAEEVYRRPAVTTYTALKTGKTFTEAVELGRQRAVDIASTDLQLAKTHTSRRVLSAKKNVVGYRRVLEGSKSCGLCIVASTQRYRKADLLPIHPSCDCGTQPIYASEDPGQVIAPESLEQLHDAIEERFGVSDRGARDPIDYRQVLVTHEHGEIGPVLAVRGQKFDRV